MRHPEPDWPKTLDEFRAWHEPQPDVWEFIDGVPKLRVPGSMAHTLLKSNTGCVLGTHLREVVPHSDTFGAHNMLSRGQEIAVEVDEGQAVDLVLEPGQMSLHQVKIFHGSHRNRADDRRIGFTIRYLPPQVHQDVGADSPTHTETFAAHKLLSRGQEIQVEVGGRSRLLASRAGIPLP